MSERILFVTTAKQCCDNAAKVAFELAFKNEAQLYLFNVIGLPYRGFSYAVTDLKSGETVTADLDYIAWVEDELKGIYEKQLASIAEEKVLTQLAVGVPATEILRFARQKEIDLIVMGAVDTEGFDSVSAHEKEIIGNTVQRVARSARCPVLIVNKHCTNWLQGLSNIVFCTDFSKRADAAFQLACATAQKYDAKLYLFHSLDTSTGSASDLEEARQLMQKKYISRMSAYDNYQIEIRVGTPYEEILKYASDNQADLIVMAHHGKKRSDIEDCVWTTVEHVAKRSACPVGTVRNSDYQSGLSVG